MKKTIQTKTEKIREKIEFQKGLQAILPKRTSNKSKEVPSEDSKSNTNLQYSTSPKEWDNKNDNQ